MHYLHHVHSASASAQSVYLPRFLPSGPCLCIVKHSSLSFVALSGEGGDNATPLSELLSVPINGRILRVARLASATLDRIAVLTDHHQPRLFVLRYRAPPTYTPEDDGNDAAVTQASSTWTAVETEATLLLEELGRPAAESGLTLEVEEGQGAGYMLSHTYAGILKVVPLHGSKAARRPSESSSLGRAARTLHPTGDVPDVAHAFGVRLPHPHLISSTFMARHQQQQPSTVALLSLSSTASRLPGLGMQCLPVLSFHTIDETNQELRPVLWGPPRKIPTQLKSPLLEASDAAAQSTSSGAGDAGSRRRSSQSHRSLPGTCEDKESDSTVTSARKPTSGRSGPAAFGTSRTLEEDIAYEEALAKAPLTRAHVPLPFMDALGAHYLLALPARAGGGVLVFSETSILIVPSPPPPTSNDALKEVISPVSPGKTKGKGSSTVLPDKRRKSSVGDTTVSPRRAAIGKADNIASEGSALSTSPTSTFAIPPPASKPESNENGKRRRSTASSATAASGSAARRRSSAAGTASQRILRLDLSGPMIVASACVVKEPQAPEGEDDGVRATTIDPIGPASVSVLFATHSGRLELLTVTLEPKRTGSVDMMPPCDVDTQMYAPTALRVSTMGQTSAPAGPGALTYVGENFAHIASASGDSMVVRLSAPMPRGVAAGALEVVHRWPVLAPILDFVVDDGAGGDPAAARSAQARIITCSGSGPTGSLRVVRNGVALTDLASLEEENVRRVWSLSSGAGPSLLLLGYLHHARILSLGSKGFEEQTDVFATHGWDTNLPVLAACSLRDSNMSVIINPSGIHAISLNGEAALPPWQPSSLTQHVATLAQEQITLAAVNEAGQALIAFKTGHLLLLQVATDGIQVITVHQLDSEPSALDVSSPPTGAAASLAIVALWKPALVKLFTLPTLRDATPVALLTPQPAMVRSVVLHAFSADAASKSAVPYLLVGLGDGVLTSYGLSLPTATSISQSIGVVERRSASLGSHPLHLRSFVASNGAHAVLAACDRSSVISLLGFGLTYSSVRYRDVRDVCQLRFPAGHEGGEDESMMVFVMADQLRIAKMGEISRLDIARIELGYDNPIALAMCPEQKAIGVVTTRFLPEGRGAAPVQGGKVLLRDCADFAALDEYALEMEERPNCIDAFKRADASYLVVGTGYTLPDRAETTTGRLLVFRVAARAGADSLLHLISSRNVEGNVFDVKAVAEDSSNVIRIVACINSSVVALQLEEDDGDVPMLEQASSDKAKAKAKRDSVSSATAHMTHTAEWSCAFTATTLSFLAPDRLVVGDALRSIVILSIDAKTGALTEVARDCDPYWTVACEVLDAEDEVYIGSDIAFNLWTCRRLKWSQSARDRLEQSRLRDAETAHRGDGAAATIDRTWSHIMKRDAAYHYGDLVNKMKRATLTAARPDAPGSVAGSAQRTPFDARLLFVTAAGAIGVIAKLDERAAQIMTHLETKLSDAWAPVGQISADEYRMLRTDHRIQPSAGFIDGDAIQRGFEPLSHEARASLLRRGRLPLDADVDEVDNLVEALSRLS